MDFCVCDRIELNRTELNPYLAQTGAAVTMLFSKLIFLVGCSFGLAVGAFDPRTGPDENSADSREGDLEARIKERREYMEARRDDANARRGSRRSDLHGRSDFMADGMEQMTDRDAFIAAKRAEMARRHSDLDLPSFDHDGESAIKDIEARHRESRVKMEQDMSERHNDMLLRRAEKYRSRASSLALSAEDRETVDKLIEDFIAKEKDMLDARMTAKTDRMRPTGDMRDAAVKEQFKADLRRSIDERKESDRVMRDEARDIRQRLEEILNSHAGADL